MLTTTSMAAVVKTCAWRPNHFHTSAALRQTSHVAGVSAVFNETVARGGEAAAHPWGPPGRPKEDTIVFDVQPSAALAQDSRFRVLSSADGRTTRIVVRAASVVRSSGGLAVRRLVQGCRSPGHEFTSLA